MLLIGDPFFDVFKDGASCNAQHPTQNAIIPIMALLIQPQIIPYTRNVGKTAEEKKIPSPTPMNPMDVANAIRCLGAKRVA